MDQLFRGPVAQPQAVFIIVTKGTSRLPWALRWAGHQAENGKRSPALSSAPQFPHFPSLSGAEETLKNPPPQPPDSG